jgi:hypothetical protein
VLNVNEAAKVNKQVFQLSKLAFWPCDCSLLKNDIFMVYPQINFSGLFRCSNKLLLGK